MNLNPTKTVLALLGPVIAAASAWLASAVAKYGVHASKAGIATALGAGVVAGVALILKLIHDVETGEPVNVGSELKAAENAAAKADPQLATELGWPPEPPSAAAAPAPAAPASPQQPAPPGPPAPPPPPAAA